MRDPVPITVGETIRCVHRDVFDELMDRLQRTKLSSALTADLRRGKPVSLEHQEILLGTLRQWENETGIGDIDPDMQAFLNELDPEQRRHADRATDASRRSRNASTADSRNRNTFDASRIPASSPAR